jgi:hypothetical protein
MKREILLMTIVMWIIVVGSTALLIHYASGLEESRATHCSQLLHGFNDGTIVPLTDDASVEIGACLLQFNQPLGGGE